MFLITPRSKKNDAQTTSRQSIAVAKIRGGPARVRAACDRCRARKVKCDGDTPCLRCTEDVVICTASRKVPGDAKAASSEYIRSMEAQQSRLIKALKDISRHVQQPVGREGIKEILETVQDCGFTFEGVVDQSNLEKRAVALSGTEMPTENNLGQAEEGNRPRKRKRESGLPAIAEISGPTVQHNQNPDPVPLGAPSNLCQSNSLQYQHDSELFDNYWDLDAYWDAVASPFLPLAPKIDTGRFLRNPHPHIPQTIETIASFTNYQPYITPTTEISTSFLNEQDFVTPSHDPSKFPESVRDSVSQPAYNAQPNDQAILPAEVLSPLADGYTLTTANPSHWESTLSTLWWDPSSLYDACLESTQ